MTIAGWTSSINTSQNDVSFDSETDTLTATGTGENTLSNLIVGYVKDESVTDCYFYTVYLTAINDYPDDASVGIKDSSESPYTSVIGETSYRKDFSTPKTGTITFYARTNVDLNVEITKSCSLQLTSITLGYCRSEFSVDNTTPLINQKVTFTNESLGSDLTYLWTISGTEDVDYEYCSGYSETSENPEVIFLTEGNFDVSLEITPLVGDSDTETKSAYISPLPIVTAQDMRKSFCIVVNNTSYRNVR